MTIYRHKILTCIFLVI